jgi:hypothetical protein
MSVRMNSEKPTKNDGQHFSMGKDLGLLFYLPSVFAIKKYH